MRQGVTDLRQFYAPPLGRVARAMVTGKVAQAWGDAAGLDVLALGYGTPFLAPFSEKSRRTVAAMPAAQGVEAWPAGERGRVCLVDEAAMPLANALFDRVLAVHALEESDNPVALLREVWRVLAPSGRVILVATARHGLWADAESTPFGHGRSFSRRQLERFVREAQLEPVGWTRALYAPPLAWTARWAEGFELAGAALWPPFAGLILMEAMKQTFAALPQNRPARRVSPVRVGLQPVPASGKSAQGLEAGGKRSYFPASAPREGRPP